MARKFVVSVDLNKNELQNARIQNLSSAPSSPVTGQVYYNTADNIMYFYNGTQWISTSGSLEVIQDAIGAYVSGGTGLTATYNDTSGTTTIDLDNTAVVAATYGAANSVGSFTVDAQGRITAASSESIQIATSQVTGLEEFIDDTVGAALTGLVRAGEGIDVTYDDNAGTLTIDAEIATDANRGVASFDSTDFTVTTGNVTLNAERVQDIVGSQLVGGTGIDTTYNDGAGTLSIDIDSTVATLTGSQTLTNKTLGSTTALGAHLDANNYKITNLATPTSANDAANKSYVDAVTEGLHIHASARVATTANIDLSTALEAGDVVDGVTLVAGDRVLVKNQDTASQNGIYVVQSSGAAVRATDFDAPAEVDGGDFIFVTNGTVSANTGWVQTSTGVATIGTDPIYFTQFSGAGAYTAGAGLTQTGTQFDVGQGTGIVVNANDVAIDTTTVARKYATAIGDGSSLTYTVTHNLNNRDVVVQIFDSANYVQVEADTSRPTVNTVAVQFAVAPTANEYRVVVIG